LQRRVAAVCHWQNQNDVYVLLSDVLKDLQTSLVAPSSICGISPPADKETVA
jgi:hypothetical protein